MPGTIKDYFLLAGDIVGTSGRLVQMGEELSIDIVRSGSRED